MRITKKMGNIGCAAAGLAQGNQAQYDARREKDGWCIWKFGNGLELQIHPKKGTYAKYSEKIIHPELKYHKHSGLACYIGSFEALGAIAEKIPTEEQTND